MFTMCPRPASRISGSAACVQYRSPSRLTFTMVRHWSVGAPSTGPSSITPALFTRMSRPPSCECASVTNACALSSSATSTGSASARPPSPSILSASEVRRSSRRAPSATTAPAPASASAVASPIPDEAPVIAATVPSSAPMTDSASSLGVSRTLRQLDQHPHAEPRRAVPVVRAPLAPRRAGDVHVHPRVIVDELAQELRRVARARLALLGGIGQIGVLALRQLEVLRVQRHPPAELAGRSRRGLDLAAPVVVVREEAGVGRAQGDDDRAGQRREVDDAVCALGNGER